MDIKEIIINVKTYPKKNIICTFNVRYPLFSEFYNFLGKSSDKFLLLQFPCIILQSEFGYYSLKKFVQVEKNKKLIEEEIDLAIQVKPENFFESLFSNRQKPVAKKPKNKLDFKKLYKSKNLYEETLLKLGKKKKELSANKKELKSIIERRKKNLEAKQKLSINHKFLEYTKSSWNRLILLKESLTKINTYLNEVIKKKKKKMAKCSQELVIYKKDVEQKKTKDIPNLKKINKGLQISNYLLYKNALNEFGYIFYNNKILNFKAFPDFYKINLDDLSLSKKLVESFYNKNYKDISIFFGNIVFMLYYLSKKFDIILPYILYYNGSKSSVFNSINIGVSNFGIDLFMKDNNKNILAYGEKNENDIQIKNEILAKMLNNVIMFFYSKKITSKNFNIDNITKTKGNRKNVYINFIKLNELILEKLEKKSN